MASISENSRKEALSRQLAASRADLGQDVGKRIVRVRQMFDVPGRTKAALGRHPIALLGAALALGLLTSVMLRRRRKRSYSLVNALADRVRPVPKATLVAGVLSMVGGMAKTAAKAYVLESIVKMVSSKTSADPPRRR